VVGSGVTTGAVGSGVTIGFTGAAGAHATATIASTSTMMDTMTNDLFLNTSWATSLNYNLLICAATFIGCRCKNTPNDWVSQVLKSRIKIPREIKVDASRDAST
jgi:hypothetical protein